MEGSREWASEHQGSWGPSCASGRREVWEQDGQSPWPHQDSPFQIMPNTLQQMAFFQRIFGFSWLHGYQDRKSGLVGSACL